MSSLFVALFALLAYSFRTRAALQAEIGQRTMLRPKSVQKPMESNPTFFSYLYT